MNFYPRAKRSFGQNFLVHKPTLATIAQFVTGTGAKKGVVELGSGTGNLTRELASRIKRVLTVELDQELIEWLKKEERLPDNVELIQQDMLELDFYQLSERLGEPVTVVGNLPYNISSQVLFRIVDQADWISSALLMFQKEVACRISARPGSRDYGILSVISQYRADVQRVMDIPPTLFSPRPKVVSSVVSFSFRPSPFEAKTLDKRFLRVVKAAFSQRRKKLVNTLASGLGLSREVVTKSLENAGIKPDIRAENVAVSGFVSLAKVI